jgi:hypothetical protein
VGVKGMKNLKEREEQKENILKENKYIITKRKLKKLKWRGGLNYIEQRKNWKEKEKKRAGGN